MSLTGILVPLVSPVAAGGGVDLGAVAANAERVLAAGVHGLYLCGGTGDAAELSAAERRRIVETVLPLARAAGASVIVHVGQAPLSAVLGLAEHALASGADAIASVPLRASWDRTLAYYQALAAVGGPVFVYHMPPAGYGASYEQLCELLGLENVAGAKLSDWNLFTLGRLVDAFRDHIFYSGLDENLGLGLLSGAHGSIGTWSNLVPEFYATMWRAAEARDHARVLELHREWQRFLALGWEGDIIGAFEALMTHRGYAAACFRVPGGTQGVSDDQLRRLAAALEGIEQMGAK